MFSRFATCFALSLVLGAGSMGCSDADDSTEPTLVDPFADEVVDYQPGAFAGFGQERFPEIVLGPPVGEGAQAGSLDVLSLGDKGSIVLAFRDVVAIDGPGVDLLVFENPFVGWYEYGVVAASEDGEQWHEFACTVDEDSGQAQGCAGSNPVLSRPENGIDPTDPESAGGDGFDLADVGLSSARYVRITDTGTNGYAGVSGGFDLDAVAVVHAGETAQH